MATSEIAQTVDEVLNVRKIKRRVWRWRIFALVLLAFVIGGVISQIGPPSGPHIARYAVTGVIVEDTERDAMLDEIAENDDVKALIVEITSPGGSVSGSEDLYNALRRVAERKPVIASMGTVAASGGYITALGADYVFARRNSMTGSIGVIFLLPFLYFLLRGKIEKTLRPKLIAMFVLGGLQGLMGWYMVKSGLVDEPRVSHYRLASHLLSALLLIVVPETVEKDKLPAPSVVRT